MRQRHFLNLLLAGALALPMLSGAARANPVVLFDLKSGQVLEHQDAFKRWYPASLSKLMTAYVTFRAIAAGEVALDSPIKMTKHSAGEPPSKMGFKPGSVMRLDNALKMMLVKSANDIAMAVGENIGGSQAAFADRMNAEAARLGMTGTHFVNPNGLYSPDQYTTARDLALLVTAIRTDFPQYAPWFSIEGLAVGKKALPNYNLLIGRYPGADGMKTGFVCSSGFNMIGSATRNGRTLVAVVLGERSAVSRAEAAARLLDQGFGMPAAGSTTLAGLQPYGDTLSPTDMNDEICKRKPKHEQSEAAPAVAAKGKQKSPYQVRLDHPTLIAVGLGGATGPAPKAFVDQTDENYADVPVPTWRPDMEVPAGAEPAATGTAAAAAQGDQSAKPAN
ncbi:MULTISPECIES: D-alanyl-D-alanine carboxypeptidase family protein [unclassified Mesorhizobium]|uniref:D-alanyl-D-alanine carboxypeptidase family protein n=1 Tax=unclassified Mesorhizobium TaxID=325217 RepID=UPI000BB0A645|nr:MULTISPECIES: D-alanyl-D-alanine carboxypeptidase family protein [unclassified Mesorhizobium]TGT63633.1 D-alanyl-D-alanine carboxypeptidase [Mesorhizobium sp. M00.F.Ca.ET.170.01.1.1]AZO11281.1 D-alanyl-D-alanine carboxypeptidase [Mesorhizobium sp. M3A.F.Ca.ET.080.04.2.1]PBB88865.1 D-alanyl-D-alanine carboxypeptidase [Mesorhizobium sp. WSM3876]RWB76599.1 MAG: D-alanyl-D-alanine carboxypeptidase [Mesorhizobium sp.]RWB92224.1 MAG: D-alanyl-D-alanine carboxypeptidase [Mesorhizobium sp.]